MRLKIRVPKPSKRVNSEKNCIFVYNVVRYVIFPVFTFDFFFHSWKWRKLLSAFFFWVHVTKKCENNGKWHKRLKNRNFLEKIAKHRYTISNATSELGNDYIAFAIFLQTFRLRDRRDRNIVTGFFKRVTNKPQRKGVSIFYVFSILKKASRKILGGKVTFEEKLPKK